MRKYLLITFMLVGFLANAAQNRVTVMTYNLENLFDTVHDEGKEDYTYMPLSVKRGAMRDVIQSYCRRLPAKAWRDQCFDWDYSEEVVHEKMRSLTGVLREVQGQYGPGPDVLILTEIENVNVLRMWVENYLSDFGYYGYLIEGPDARGIDQAVLTRLRPIDAEPPQYFGFPETGSTDILKARRGYLNVNLWLPDGMPLSLFAMHLPSPGSPRELREAALYGLNDLKHQLPHGRVVLAGGDINVTSAEEDRYAPIANIIYPEWMRVELDCTGCRGTYYYPRNKEWSFLDRIFVARNTQPIGQTQWKIDRNSVRVVDSAYGQTDAYGRPIRFDPTNSSGVVGISDHLPLVFDLYK
ncbi:endonuclease/exonuclease/phosphatase family protein [bacterium]|nr:endonuclease/exonuclease/phosphatase family protein [bacterium]